MDVIVVPINCLANCTCLLDRGGYGVCISKCRPKTKKKEKKGLLLLRVTVMVATKKKALLLLIVKVNLTTKTRCPIRVVKATGTKLAWTEATAVSATSPPQKMVTIVDAVSLVQTTPTFHRITRGQNLAAWVPVTESMRDASRRCLGDAQAATTFLPHSNVRVLRRLFAYY